MGHDVTRVLAVDPGTTKSALVLWDGDRVLFSCQEENEQVLNRLRCFREEYSHAPIPLAIEMIASYGMAVGKEVFETCVWVGRFMQAYSPEHTTRIQRLEVKMHLCHNSKAKDANIRQAIIDRYGPPGTKNSPGVLYGISTHLWAALAVGILFHDRIHVKFGKLAKRPSNSMPTEGLFAKQHPGS